MISFYFLLSQEYSQFLKPIPRLIFIGMLHLFKKISKQVFQLTIQIHLI
jgi:hypothetical protein